MGRDEFYIQAKRENEWELIAANQDILRLSDEYTKIWSKIENGDNFAFLRYGDGELALMLGREVRAQEGWHAEAKLTQIGEKLRETLTPASENMIYGIPCPCCHSEGYYWYLNHLGSATISFANLWVNYNFRRFRNDIAGLDRETVLITNRAGKGKTYGGLRIKKHFFVSDDCIQFWEEEGKQFIQNIISETASEKGLLYAVAAGPLSEIIIWELYKNNPMNCYIDFGSALDYLTHGKITRPYMVDEHALSRKNCWMFDPKIVQTDVDVVLSAYKRPEVLSRQLEAVQAQTLQPKRVLLYQDGIDSYYKIRFDQEMLDRFDDYFISPENGGVWQRFAYAAKEATSKYVCIFDDDTVPGKRWLENCHMNMMQHRGIYGTNGILLDNLEYPGGGGGIHIGWHVPNETTCEADFVGHSWFFESEWLAWMLAKPYRQRFKYVGEDMSLSFACWEHGIKTYVPAHPVRMPSLWGSQPKFGEQFGRSAAAVSVNQANQLSMNEALMALHSDGWRSIFEEDIGYIEKMKLNVELRYYHNNGRFRDIEAHEQLEQVARDAGKAFLSAKRKHDIEGMVWSLLRLRPMAFSSFYQDREEKKVFEKYYLSVITMAVHLALFHKDANRALFFLTALSEITLKLYKEEIPLSFLYYGITYYHRHEYLESQNFIRQYLEIFPKDERAFFYLGNSFLCQGRLAEALDSYSSALSVKRNYTEALSNIAYIAKKTGDDDTARTILATYLKDCTDGIHFEEDAGRFSTVMQETSFFDIPIFINARDRVVCMKLLVDWLLKAGYRRIYILDNASTFSPLLSYYDEIKKEESVTVLYMKKNLGPYALWISGLLEVLHISTPYVLTDPDVLPVERCPHNVLETLLQLLEKYPFIDRIGLGLKTDDVPYGKEDLLLVKDGQEKSIPIQDNLYFGMFGQKFALYRNYRHINDLATLWTDGDLAVRHRQWYVNYDALPEDESYYIQHADKQFSSVIRNL